MVKPSTKQVVQTMSVLGNNADFESIEPATLQTVIDDPIESGRQFTLFLKNHARLIIGEPKKILLDHICPFSPAEFIGQGWTIWLGSADGNGLSGEPDQDLREQTLAEVDFSQALIENCLKDGEASIKGEEKLRRLKEAGNTRLGGATFLALWRDYQTNKENSVLEWLYRNRKITYLDFFGLVLRSPNGSRCVLYLYRYEDGEWYWNYGWLAYDWESRHGAAGLANNRLQS